MKLDGIVGRMMDGHYSVQILFIVYTHQINEPWSNHSVVLL